MTDDGDNVIHVAFGAAGGRQSTSQCAAEPLPAQDQDVGADPLAQLYTASEVAALFAFPASRLRSWDRSGFLRPSGRTGRRRCYTFQDLIGLRVAKGLLQQGVPFRAVRRSVDALRESLPRVARPLSELRIVADGGTVTVRDAGSLFEPTTGQLVLDFGVGDLCDDVVRVLRPTGTPDRKTAYELYLEGCRLDETEATYVGAEEAYRKAAELDPSLSSAYTNLGNLRFRRGHLDDAELLYRQALEVDPTQPEAYYNLGFLCFERGEPEASVAHFERALESDPSFADAHFNLAMAYEDLGRHEDAKIHWQAYLQIDPGSPWAEIAERHIR